MPARNGGNLSIENQELCLSWGLKQINKFLKDLLAVRPICLRFVAMGGAVPKGCSSLPGCLRRQSQTRSAPLLGSKGPLGDPDRGAPELGRAHGADAQRTGRALDSADISEDGPGSGVGTSLTQRPCPGASCALGPALWYSGLHTT